MTRKRRIAVELLLGALLVAGAATRPVWMRVVRAWSMPELATGTRVFEGAGVRFEYPPLFVEDLGPDLGPDHASLTTRDFTNVSVVRMRDLFQVASAFGCDPETVTSPDELPTAPRVLPSNDARSVVERVFGERTVRGVRDEWTRPTQWTHPAMAGEGAWSSVTESFAVPVGDGWVLVMFSSSSNDGKPPLAADDETVGLVTRTFAVTG